MTKHNPSRFSRSPTFVPPIERWPAAGVYQLRLRVSVAIRVRIGRLGRFVFLPGLYVYTGRASRGLRARVLRHVCGARTKRWHIDYLLARREVWVERVELASDNPQDECLANRAIRPKAPANAPSFGASDCKRHCGTH
ncbi:MAG: GIY-YIG nuclease family protein, partial [Planctomycetes bacterium]|nr:GIY-YIG nuclease family protein [Planctomycetota bacterium]